MLSLMRNKSHNHGTYSWQNSSGTLVSDQRRARRDCSKNRGPGYWNKHPMLQQLHYVWTLYTPDNIKHLTVKLNNLSTYDWFTLTSRLEPLFGGRVGSPSSNVQSGLYKRRENNWGTNNDPTTIPAPKLTRYKHNISNFYSMSTLNVFHSLPSISIKLDSWSICELKLPQRCWVYGTTINTNVAIVNEVHVPMHFNKRTNHLHGGESRTTIITHNLLITFLTTIDLPLFLWNTLTPSNLEGK